MLTASAASVTPVKAPSGTAPAGGKKPKPGCDEVDMETRVQMLEDRWQELNNLPTNSEMFRRLRKFKEIEESPPGEPGTLAGSAAGSNIDARAGPPCPGLPRTCHPMSELWHAMQLLSQVETNTEGIARVRTASVCYLYVLPASAPLFCTTPSRNSRRCNNVENYYLAK